MKASTVELVFVIDASESMRPCFEGLANNLDRVIQPLHGESFKVRLGLVAMSAGRTDNGGRLFRTVTLCGNEEPIYHGDSKHLLFTEDRHKFSSMLRAISLQGDENNLFALDFALDFPFGPISNTRRVVALFSDEKIEDGMVEEDDLDKIPQIIEKIMARRIQLFAALPYSAAIEALGGCECARIEKINGGDGLASVNFDKLLAQMAKSISVSSLQGDEGSYTKALFGQDGWVRATGTFDGMR